MSDTIIKFYSKWIDSTTNALSLDGVFIFGELLIALVFVCLVAYKLASFDYEILYSSRSVIKFMRLPKSKRLYGSLNYHMRSFPNDISRAWERYFVARVGKPSEYLTRDLSSNYGVFESGLKPIMPLAVAFSTLINLVFTLQYKKLPISTTLIMPIFTLTFGIVCIVALNIFFNVIKRLAAKKYCEMVRLLDFHSMSDFSSFLAPKIKPVPTSKKPSEEIPLRFKKEFEFSKPATATPFDPATPTLSQQINSATPSITQPCDPTTTTLSKRNSLDTKSNTQSVDPTITTLSKRNSSVANSNTQSFDQQTSTRSRYNGSDSTSNTKFFDSSAPALSQSNGSNTTLITQTFNSQSPALSRYDDSSTTSNEQNFDSDYQDLAPAPPAYVSNDVVNVQERFKERVLENTNSPKELESLAVNLTLAKNDQKSNEQTLNDAINNLMNTIAQTDTPQDLAN